MKDQEKATRGPCCIERHFPIKEIVPGVLEMFGTLKKIKGEQLLPCYKYRPSRETGNNCRKPKKSRHFLCPLIPTRPFEGSLDDSEGNRYGGNRLGEKYARLRNISRKTMLSEISSTEKLSYGCWRCLGPLKKSKLCGKLATILENQRKPNEMPCSDSFPPGPSRFLSDESKRNVEEIGD